MQGVVWSSDEEGIARKYYDIVEFSITNLKSNSLKISSVKVF